MNRRSFVKNSVALSTLLTACPSEFKLKAPLNKKSLKFNMIQIEGMSILDKFRLIKEIGYDGVELTIPSSDLSDKEILNARDKSGIEIPGLVNSRHWDQPISSPDPAIRKACTDSMIFALEKCKTFGGNTVLLVSGVVNKEISYNEAWDRSTAEITKMIPTAEKTGVKIAVENVWNNFLISPIEAAQFIDQFDTEMVGWYFDVGNILRYGWPEHWIKTLGHRILKIDIKDYSRTKMSEEGIWEGFKVEIGDGDNDWATVNNALREVGYSGWGSAEVSGGDRDRLIEINKRLDNIYAL